MGGRGELSAQREERRIRFEFAMPRAFSKVGEERRKRSRSKRDDQ